MIDFKIELGMAFDEINQTLLNEIECASLIFNFDNDYILDNYSGYAYDEMTTRFAEKNPRLSDPSYTFSLLVNRNPIYIKMYEKMRKAAEIDACWDAFETYTLELKCALKGHKESMLYIGNPFAKEVSGYGFLDEYHWVK